jgi:hypothetical protein
MRRGVSSATAVRWGGGTLVKSRCATLMIPATIRATMAVRNRKVGRAKSLPAWRTPRRLPASRIAITSTLRSTVAGRRPGSADVTDATPADTDTETVRM